MKSRIQVTKRGSALLSYHYYRKVGFSRRTAYEIAVAMYGWPTARPYALNYVVTHTNLRAGDLA